jgi:PKD repeat protein
MTRSVILLAAAIATGFSVQSITFESLGQLGTNGTNPRGVNRSGVVVGGGSIPTTNCGTRVWAFRKPSPAAAFTLLNPINDWSDGQSEAWEINDQGTVSGSATRLVVPPCGGVLRAVVWAPGSTTATELPMPTGVPAFTGTATGRSINNAGDVVGFSQALVSSSPLVITTGRATVWTGGPAPTVLGLLPGAPSNGASDGLDINDQGHAVGWSHVSVGGITRRRPFYSTGTGMQALQVPATVEDVEARAINNADVIVGLAEVQLGSGAFQAHLVRWASPAAAMEDLGASHPLGPGAPSQAVDLNDAGHIAGTTNLRDPDNVVRARVFLWVEGVWHGLRTDNQAIITSGLVGLSGVTAANQVYVAGTAHTAPSPNSSGGRWTVQLAATNQSPVADAGGPYQGTEGAAVQFDGSGSSDADEDQLTYGWDFGDGATGTGVSPTHTYTDEGTGSYTVTLTVQDGEGGSHQATAAVAITNTNPVVNAGSDVAIPQAQAFTLTASFVDAGAQDDPWAYTVDWGDGTPLVTGSTATQGALTPAPSHQYQQAGIRTVTVAVTDEDGGAGSAAIQVQAHYPFAGFFPPVDQPEVAVNRAKAGSGIPIKFSLQGDRGLGIFRTDTPYPNPRFVHHSCNPDEPQDPIESTTTSPAGLTYDATTDTYTYVWKTDKGWAGRCGTFHLGLLDGSDHQAEFQFTR